MAENTQLSVDPEILLLMVPTNTYNSKAMEEISALNDKGNYNNICLNHNLIKNSQILAIEKLIPKELYSLYLLF